MNDQQLRAAQVDRESVLAAIRHLAHALGRAGPDWTPDPVGRARALSSLVAETVTAFNVVCDLLAAALATEAQPLPSLRILPPLTLAERLSREHLALRSEHEAACAAILDLQEEQGAYRRGRADGLRLAAEVVAGGAEGYGGDDLRREWVRRVGANRALSAMIRDLIDHPERWQPGNEPPAQPAGPALEQAPDPLGVPPNPTEADLDLAAVGALASIYGTHGAAWMAINRLDGLLAELTANAHAADTGAPMG